MADLYQIAKNVNSRENFLEFIDILVKDFQTNRDRWENTTVDGYLDGLGSWVEDMDSYYKNNNLAIPENINWSVFADILGAARVYE